MKVDMSPEAITGRLHAMDELWVLSVKLMNSMPKGDGSGSQALEIQDSIRHVLFNDWNPLGINDHPSRGDEYDAYIAPLYRILVGGRSQTELIDTLSRIAPADMGVDAGSPDKLQMVAEKLLELKVTLD